MNSFNDLHKYQYPINVCLIMYDINRHGIAFFYQVGKHIMML